MEYWECRSCRALTPEGSENCWNCRRSRNEPAAANPASASVTQAESSSDAPPKGSTAGTIDHLLVGLIWALMCLIGFVILCTCWEFWILPGAIAVWLLFKTDQTSRTMGWVLFVLTTVFAFAANR
jgi:hypothetical protein